MDIIKFFCFILIIKLSAAESSDWFLNPRLIVQQGPNKIQAFDVVNRTSVTLLETSDSSEPIVSFDLHKKETIYYSIDSSAPIMSSSEKYENLWEVSSMWNITSVAVDSVSNIIYGYDEAAKTLMIFDMHGKYYNIMLSDLDTFKGIVIHPGNGFVTILTSTRIRVYKADGLFLKTIAKGNNMATLAMDGNNIYWTEDNNQIKVFIYEYFKEVRNVTKAHGTVISLAILENDLFYISQNITGNYNLYRCSLKQNGLCEGPHEHIPFNDPRMLKSYDPDDSGRWSNCAPYKIGCEHFCFPNRDLYYRSSATCACNIGWKLRLDERSCSRVDELGLYMRGKYLRGRVLEPIRNNFAEAFTPIGLNEMNLVRKRTTEFDFNAYKNYIILADDQGGMSRLNIDAECLRGCEDLQGYRVLERESYNYMYPAVDWINDNIYYLQTSRIVGISYLKVHRSYKYLEAYSSINLDIYVFDLHEKPRAIVVQPNDYSRLFITLYDLMTKQVRIYSIYPSDKQLNSFPNLSHGNERLSINETCLGIDHVDPTLYWFNAAKTEVQYVSLNDSDQVLKTFQIPFIQNPVSINIHGDWMYLSNKTDVYRVYKLTGEYAKKIMPTDKEGTLSAFKVYGTSSQPIRLKTPCNIENGGCSDYCFFDKIKNLKTCKCDYDMKLLEDKKTCSRSYQESLCHGHPCIFLPETEIY